MNPADRVNGPASPAPEEGAFNPCILGLDNVND